MKKLSMLLVVTIIVSMLTTFAVMPASAEQTVYCNYDMSGYTGKNPTIFSQAFPGWNETSYWNGSAYNDAEYGNGLQMGTAAVVEHTLTTPITSGKVLLRVNAKVLDTSSYTNVGFLGMLMNDSELTGSTSPAISSGDRNSKPQAFKIRVAKNSVTVSTSATGGYANIYNDTSVAVTEGEWHQYDTLVDFTAGKKHIYVDGKLLTDCTLDDAIQTNGIKSVLISANNLSSANDNKGVVVDNFKICTLNDSFAVSSASVDTATKKITVKFNEVLDGDFAPTTAVITAEDNSDTKDAASITKKGFNSLEIAYEGILSKNKKYKVTFGADVVKDEFGNTLSGDISFTTPAGYQEYYSNDMSGYNGGKVEMTGLTAFPNYYNDSVKSYWNGSAYNDAEYGNGLQMGTAAVVEHTLTTPITSGKVLLRVNAKVLDTSSYTNVGFLGMLMNDSEITMSTSPNLSQSARNDKPQAFKIRVANNSVTVSTSATGGYGNIYKKDEVDQTVAVTEREWHQYDTLVDFTAGKKYIYVDGKLLTDCTLDSAIQTNGIKSVLISANSLLSANDNKGVVVDNFKICTMQESFEAEKVEVDTATKKITVKFNEVLAGDLAATTAVINDASGTPYTSVNVAKTGFDTLTFTYSDDELPVGKGYTMGFAEGSEIKDEFGNTLSKNITFDVKGTGMTLDEVKLTTTEGAAITDLTAFNNAAADVSAKVSGSITNWDGKDGSAVLLVAAYDSTGMKLTYVGTKSLTVTGYEYTINEEITIPKNTEVGKIKLFVWSGLSTPAPLGGTTVIPAE